MIAIDFNKAFDSVSREFFFVPYALFVLALLLSNGFTLFIIIFLAVFQTIVSLPQILTFISPYLFIIVLETLASTIRSDNDIRGIQVDGQEIKLGLFADDLTGVLKNENSLIKFWSRYEP